MSRCIMVDGMLLRVDRRFDETPGSPDMVAAAELVASMRRKLDDDAKPLDERPIVTDAGSRSRR